MCDDFDFGQIDDCGDGYFNDALTLEIEELMSANAALTHEDYADIFLENFH